MRKRWIRYVFLIALVLVVLTLLNMKWLPSFKSIFKAQPVTIENTPILIKEINELAQLCTITAFDEVVADSVVMKMKSPIETLLPDLSGFGNLPVTGKRLVLIGKGKIIAGVDLRKLNEQSVFAEGDSVSIILPAAEILDAIMNPADFETFSETGEWSSEAVTAVKIKARTKMIERSVEQGILTRANARSIVLIENFLRGLGFKKVRVQTAG
ncbi:DUF4230 domain-containing protein [Agriterribacter sp.]|uniref:DUF4230 domain-containing protein n=1 Tax=Agriterribacter sp. TaxID=2821509 RepID=UPI002B5198D4|nr:DUF4230 domain-containing protein [Agriterribacter sp.]HRO47100.1 DUF4230 domain-containing protein [Agriterribacter sp.]HRQ17857.1 DUF4230 domain-containing protein [Agriterribacter sp.]